MILVNSSVWIDYFRGVETRASDRLDELLGREEVAVGDLILTEVLQGFTSKRDFQHGVKLMQQFTQINIGGAVVAVQAARNYQFLRTQGVTVRKTIDILIATRCVEDGMPLLHNDRDFDAFTEHLGLVSVL